MRGKSLKCHDQNDHDDLTLLHVMQRDLKLVHCARFKISREPHEGSRTHSLSLKNDDVRTHGGCLNCAGRMYWVDVKPNIAPWSLTKIAKSWKISFTSWICSCISLMPCSRSNIMASLYASSLSTWITSCLVPQHCITMKKWDSQIRIQCCWFHPSVNTMVES